MVDNTRMGSSAGREKKSGRGSTLAVLGRMSVQRLWGTSEREEIMRPGVESYIYICFII